MTIFKVWYSGWEKIVNRMVFLFKNILDVVKAFGGRSMDTDYVVCG